MAGDRHKEMKMPRTYLLIDDLHAKAHSCVCVRALGACMPHVHPIPHCSRTDSQVKHRPLWSKWSMPLLFLENLLQYK